MTVTVEYAAKHLEELLETVDGGTAVKIVRPDKPEVTIPGAVKAVEIPAGTGKRVLGAGRGELPPISDEEWDRMDKEWRKSFEDKFGSDAA